MDSSSDFQTNSKCSLSDDKDQALLGHLMPNPVIYIYIERESSSHVNSTLWMHHMDADKAYREKARQELHKNAVSYVEQILEAASHETAAIRSPTFDL